MDTRRKKQEIQFSSFILEHYKGSFSANSEKRIDNRFKSLEQTMVLSDDAYDEADLIEIAQWELQELISKAVEEDSLVQPTKYQLKCLNMHH